MKKNINNLTLTTLLTMSAMGFVSQANAAGTLAGTSITNTANLQFAIGGVAQTPKASNTVSFVVDRKINLVLVEDNGGVPVLVSPGGQDYIFKMKLTNLGNAPQDFALGAQHQANGILISGLTDNFNMSGCTPYGDTPTGTGVYTEGVSTFAFVDEVAPDTTRSVFLVCNTPVVQLNNDVSIISINAIAREAGTIGTNGLGITQTTGANTVGVDTVFADSDSGGFNSDSARNGRVSTPALFLVKSATLTVSKTNTPLCDPYNFTTNPKNIPGAFVRYNITVSNNAGAGASANLNTLTDILTSNVNFDSNLIAPTASSCSTATPAESAAGRGFKVSCSGTGNSRACATTPMYRTTVGGDDGFDFTGSTITAGFGAALATETGYTAGELKAGESITLEFNVEVK